MPASTIFIGESGANPISNVIRASLPDPLFTGLAPYTPGQGNGVYIGYDPATDSWSLAINRAGFWARDVRISSGIPIELLETIGFDSSNGAVQDLLWLQTDSGFVDATSSASLDFPSACIAGAAADFDNDADLDIYLVCRHWAGNLPNILLENLGTGMFRVVPATAGAPGSLLGRGENVATADIDRDGGIDLFVTNGLGAFPFNEGPYEVYRNSSSRGNWIGIDLIGVQSNRDGVGARVTLSSGGKTQFRLQDGGMHRFSQNHKRLHFGLADSDVVDALAIDWPER